jgi:hypothetical protein
MQYPVNHPSGVRSCAMLLAMLAVLATGAAPARADGVSGADASEADRMAARALFRAENAIGAGRGAPQVASAGTARLEEQRGGSDTGKTNNTMRLDGNVGANTAINVTGGANSIDSGAFANMAGIPVVIQNSGANVLIQSATIINLQFK